MIDLLVAIAIGPPLKGVVHDAAKPMTLVEQAVHMGYPPCATESDITPPLS